MKKLAFINKLNLRSDWQSQILTWFRARAVRSHYAFKWIRAFRLILLCLMVIIAVGESSVRAASEYDSDAKTVAGVISTVGTGATSELSPSKIFTSDSSAGKNLYTYVYQKVKSEGSDLAVARTLTHHSLTEQDLYLLVPGSNISTILTEPKMTPEKVAAKRAEIERFLAEEKELADLEVLTKIEVQPTELFANGDESDSGFDLLSDLDMIDAILFGKTQTVLSEAGPGAPAGTHVVDLTNVQDSAKPPTGAPPLGPPQQDPVNKQGQSGQLQPPGQQPAPQPPGSSPPQGTGVKNNKTGQPVKEVSVCPLNVSFDSAVKAVREAELQVTASNGGTTASKTKNGVGVKDNQNGKDGTGADTLGSGNPPPGQKKDEGADTDLPPPEKPANWARPPACTDVFCLKFEAIYKKASLYQTKDNCIACHFEKINDAFKKTLSHNLAPSKETGSIGEGPKCKRLLLNLKWNLVLIPQPILTPPNDDLVVKGDFIKNLTSFYEKYYKNPGRCAGGTGGACKPDDALSKIPTDVLNQAVEGTDQSTVLGKIQTQTAAIQAQQATVIQQTRLENDANVQAQQFQVIMQEIDTMITYFQSFINLFNQINSEPCQNLLNKEQCN